MKSDKSRAGQTRPSMPSLGRRERLELFSARVPWSLKLIVVYVVIGAVLLGAFLLVDFDVAWMREHAWRIIRDGLPLTLLPHCGYAWGRVPVITEIQAGVLALCLNYGAYMTEIFRAGIQSVGHGQGEAADALGMSYRTKMRRIVFPQAVRVIIPPTGNEFIAMLKDSALVYTIGALELFRLADLAGRRDFRSLEAYLLAAMVYWVLTGIFTVFQARLERRMGRGYVRGGDARGGAPRPPSARAQPGIVTPEVVPVAVEPEAR